MKMLFRVSFVLVMICIVVVAVSYFLFDMFHNEEHKMDITSSASGEVLTLEDGYKELK